MIKKIPLKSKYHKLLKFVNNYSSGINKLSRLFNKHKSSTIVQIPCSGEITLDAG